MVSWGYIPVVGLLSHMIVYSLFLKDSPYCSLWWLYQFARGFPFLCTLSSWIPFISFSSLIVMARISKAMLHNSGESGHPCLVPNFRGNAFTFSVLRILAEGLSFMAFIMLRYFASWASLVVQMVKHLPAMWETLAQSLGWEDPLETGMATHSSILAWRIPSAEETGRLQFTKRWTRLK